MPGNFLLSEKVTIDWKFRRIVASSLTFWMPSMMTDLTDSVEFLGDLRKMSRVHTAVKTTRARIRIIVAPKILCLLNTREFVPSDNSMRICNLLET